MTPTPHNTTHPDHGNSTILTIGLLTCLTTLCLTALALTQANIATTTTHTAADAAALAGALAHQNGQNPCQHAKKLATTHHTTLTTCTVTHHTVTVQVHKPTKILGITTHITKQARAEPKH